MTAISMDRARVRELDRRAMEEYGVPGLVLMENAGRGAADVLCRLGVAGKVVICCGKGNNGGDGFVIARHLDLRGIEVEILAWGWPPLPSRETQLPPASGQWPPGMAENATNASAIPTPSAPNLPSDAHLNYWIAHRSHLPIHLDPNAAQLATHLASAAWIIDALLGTGAQGSPRAPFDEVIRAINAAGKPVLAVDIPSGLDCDTGIAADPTIRALHTCTFVASKPGFHQPGAAAYTGQVHVCDIGAPRRLVDEMLAGCGTPRSR